MTRRESTPPTSPSSIPSPSTLLTAVSRVADFQDLKTTFSSGEADVEMGNRKAQKLGPEL